MHRISYIAIKNFRSCQNVSLPLDEFTPLVGQNNVGKSTILDAIKWGVKPVTLVPTDFADPKFPVVVVACISGISTELLDRIPDQRHRAAIEPFCRNETLWVRVVATGTGKASIAQEVWDVDACADLANPDKWRAYPTGLPQAVSVLLPEALHIAAMDDLSEDLGKAKAGTTIKALLDEIMVPVLAAHADIKNALDTIGHILTASGNNRSGHLATFDSEVSRALVSFFPGLALDLDLQMIDVKEFFKAGDLHVTDQVTGDRRRFDQMGTGAQRAIQMALIRYLADTRAKNPQQTSRRLLLIDEPELYLHPQGVRRLRETLRSLSKSGFQVVFSTHSPLMLSRENAPDTVVVTKTAGTGTSVLKPLRQAVRTALSDAEAQSRTLFELGNLAEVYFSERVVLCEGKTDRRILPLAYERLMGCPPELDRITFVSVGSCSDIPKALLVLEAMGIKSCAVADLDFAFVEARKGGFALLEKDGEDINEAKAILLRLQQAHSFPLGGNGLPTKGNDGWQAADTWALFASDGDGRRIANSVHEALKRKRIWVWPAGCIEQVTGTKEKGEDAILKQEATLQGMDATNIDHDMPGFKPCFEWLRSV
ncbi:ATP-dependent nuclease [Burkholderia vietnamiensis]|uniref:ATP-dependent nuclease n=1 Tax=Burkholderia vietnamiensis TaxID=60552 RepID=UPI00075BC587|nr:AAA family ATPase [Burkholderia vietnamiensis]KVE96831.1 AAA family ATPase [Burkholderia vietnamiensis]